MDEMGADAMNSGCPIERYVVQPMTPFIDHSLTLHKVNESVERLTNVFADVPTASD